MEIPTSLKQDRNVAPYLARAAELHTVNPVVSYYCKIYVLDHILSNRLHVGNSEVEKFTVALLDDTESIKNSHEDEEVRAALVDRQVSLNLVFAFGFRLFTSSLEDLAHYDGTTKVQLASKMRAVINFLSVLSVFTGEEDPSIDFSKTSGGKCANKDEFDAFVKDKIKTIKYQLSRLIKDEVPIQGEEAELDELVDVNDLSNPLDADADTGVDDGAKEPVYKKEEETKDEEGANLFPSAPTFVQDSPASPDSEHVPDSDPFKLPGAPKFDPASEDTDSDVKLPGAPKFLPDDDISHINKKSSIQVFPASPKEEKAPPHINIAPSKPVESKPVHHATSHKPITKEDLAGIVDTTEQIAQAQKHAKFAISALNYEDLDTAERELTRSMELVRLVREHSDL